MSEDFNGMTTFSLEVISGLMFGIEFVAGPDTGMDEVSFGIAIDLGIFRVVILKFK